MAEPDSAFYVGLVFVWRRLWIYLSAALVFYALLLSVLQVLFWIRSGSWVEVPTSALWFQPAKRSFPYPLAIVPHITDPKFTPDLFLEGPNPTDSREWKRFTLWLLEMPLAVWVVFCAFLIYIALFAEPDVPVESN